MLGEYRESMDVDFLCASEQGYRRLRELTFSGDNSPLLTPGSKVDLLRVIRTDQYGIRTWLGVDGARVKFEIVSEARINLSGATSRELAIPVLSKNDLFCEKLLANADRYADKSVMSRDIIDLCIMISRWGSIPATAWDKARKAYGASVEVVFDKASAKIRDTAWLTQCMNNMAMEPGLEQEILGALNGTISSTR